MGFIIFNIILLFILVGTPVGFILHKTRILYPLAYIYLFCIILSHDTWFIYKILNTTIGEIICIGLFFLVVICSFISAVKKLIGVFIYGFEWHDIPEHFRYKKDEKSGRLPYQVEAKMFNLFPQLEQDKYFFKNNCRNETEEISFSSDWNFYIYTLKDYYDSHKTFLSFEDWFENCQRWKNSSYNHYYLDKLNIQKQEEFKKDFRNSNEKKNPDTGKNHKDNLFAGITTKEQLVKRYKDLLKIYHPDNQAGDTSMSQYIQQEYEKLLSKF